MGQLTPHNGELQYGRQTPDGKVQWHNAKTAAKLGWTTAQGRLIDQGKFDAELERLGLALHDGNIIKWWTRVQYLAWTEPVALLDSTATADEEQMDAAAPPVAFAADGPQTVGTVVDVSGSAEPGDPTHLVVDDTGLLVGAVTPAATVPEWAQTPAPTPGDTVDNLISGTEVLPTATTTSAVPL